MSVFFNDYSALTVFFFYEFSNKIQTFDLLKTEKNSYHISSQDSAVRIATDYGAARPRVGTKSIKHQEFCSSHSPDSLIYNGYWRHCHRGETATLLGPIETSFRLYYHTLQDTTKR